METPDRLSKVRARRLLVLTALIAVVIGFALWNLVLKILLSIISSSGFDPTDYAVFQAFFGMIFTVIIALEFKRSLLVVAERRHGIVQVRNRAPDRAARHCPQADDHRSFHSGGPAGVRACSRDSGARRRVLARSRTGQARAGLRCNLVQQEVRHDGP